MTVGDSIVGIGVSYGGSSVTNTVYDLLLIESMVNLLFLELLVF